MLGKISLSLDMLVLSMVIACISSSRIDLWLDVFEMHQRRRIDGVVREAMLRRPLLELTLLLNFCFLVEGQDFVVVLMVNRSLLILRSRHTSIVVVLPFLVREFLLRRIVV